MPTNAQNGQPSGTLTPNSEAATAKKKKARASRKASSPSTSRSLPAGRPARDPASSAEIIFKDLPNPSRTPPPPFIWIDHPLQSERLLSPVYVVRLGVGGADQVEICVDGGVWQTCRLTSGYWWYDWSGIQPGRHTLAARMRTADGRWYRTPPRACEFRP